MVTLKDVAKKAGVSVAGASRALHNNGYISKEAKESEDEVIVISPSKNNTNNMENAELGENPKEDN